jgi:uncharacterized protein (TIGR02145 family)
MKKLLFVALLLICSALQAQISDDIQADRYLLGAKTALDNQNYAQAADLLEKITHLNVNPPSDFYYFYAYSLYKNYDFEEALKNVKLYIEIEGKNGSNNQQALELWNNIENPQFFVDSRDGKTYKAVKIGNQIWMAENLNYDMGGSWCYENSTSNCDKYGRLYTWEAAREACPPGWHLPSDSEWSSLTNYLGGEEVAGGKLKSTSLWESPNTGATNSSGFTGLPGGVRVTDGSFGSLSYGGYWWSSSPGVASSAWSRYMYYDDAYVSRFSSSKSYGFSVRCLKD